MGSSFAVAGEKNDLFGIFRGFYQIEKASSADEVGAKVRGFSSVRIVTREKASRQKSGPLERSYPPGIMEHSLMQSSRKWALRTRFGRSKLGEKSRKAICRIGFAERRSVAMGYVRDTVFRIAHLRNDRFGQGLLLQEIVLDAIDEHF